jgi:hypothetical protein
MTLELLDPQPDLPPGPTWRCSDCGARIRTGEPHAAVEPRPHATLAPLTVTEPLEDWQ